MSLSRQEKERQLLLNDATSYQVIRSGGTWSDVAYELYKNQERLIAEITRLKGIAPMRIRLHDGTEMIYRCPDQMVPVVDIKEAGL